MIVLNLRETSKFHSTQRILQRGIIMLINIGKLASNDEVIINTENISRIYKKEVNLSVITPNPYKYSIYMNDGKNFELALNAADNKIFRELINKFDYYECNMSAPIIKLF